MVTLCLVGGSNDGQRGRPLHFNRISSTTIACPSIHSQRVASIKLPAFSVKRKKKLKKEQSTHAGEKVKDYKSHLFEEECDKARGSKDAVIDTTKTVGENLPGTVYEKGKNKCHEATGEIRKTEETVEDVVDIVKTSGHQVKENLNDIPSEATR
ncbi:hypothetical protein NE237_016618 [Protea cynaroides]|uniref:Uncharacterized protein n=1 Tax=Protea cynaroides TaxID=273540 RepID=A0A9Q0HF56_9MAGN|nr:hypothetical protein NE237_016618 [Protea cynaroides]